LQAYINAFHKAWIKAEETKSSMMATVCSQKIRVSKKEPTTCESGWLFLYEVGNVLEIYAIKNIWQRDT
jgi:hypothetical protein